MTPEFLGVFPCIILGKKFNWGSITVPHNSVNNDETAYSGDKLDNLLHEFRTRNEFRADPNYVLEPVDVDTPIPDRFIKILRDSSLSFPDIEEAEEIVETETEPNSGLLLLAENYEKNSRKKIQLARIYGAIAGVILFVAALVFSALAGNILMGIIVTVVAAAFLGLSRTSKTQAQEIQKIAAALNQPEETP